MFACVPTCARHVLDYTSPQLPKTGLSLIAHVLYMWLYCNELNFSDCVVRRILAEKAKRRNVASTIGKKLESITSTYIDARSLYTVIENMVHVLSDRRWLTSNWTRRRSKHLRRKWAPERHHRKRWRLVNINPWRSAVYICALLLFCVGFVSE